MGLCWMSETSSHQFNQNSILFIAHSDGSIMRWDPSHQGSSSLISNASSPQVVGQHDAPVKDIFCFNNNSGNILVSGGYDCMVKFWQINGQQLTQIGQSYVGKPVHLLSGAFPILVTAHSERIIHIWNLQNL